VTGGSQAASSDALRSAPEEARALVRSFLSDEEELAWYGLLETHEALVRALDARLLAEHQLPLSAFEALIQIAHAEDGTISISDLAERIRLSPSQVSRLVIDLERRGLVQRHRSSTDARSTHAAITEAGQAELRKAAPTYLSTVRAHLFDRLSEREVKQLRRIWERIRGKRR
jgi:DNA-binding MarR family transcriptional regulator